MSVWKKIRGTIETAWQIGIGGPNLKANSGAIDVRNAGDSAYAVVRGASPVGNNDLATKQYVDTLATRYVIAGQFDGNNALPSNTGTARFLVVTTTGANATIGDLIWDDGTSTGTATRLVTTDRLIITQTALTGGTVSLAADTMYWWDTGTSSWINVGGSTLSGARRTISMAVTNAASQNSAASIPANATVYETFLDVTTPFSAGAAISVGRTGSTALIMATTDNSPQTAGQWAVPQRTPWGASALPVLVTITGAPAAGAATLVVTYAQPDA